MSIVQRIKKWLKDNFKGSNFEIKEKKPITRNSDVVFVESNPNYQKPKQIPTMLAPYGDRYSQEFFNAVELICFEFGWPKDCVQYLLACIGFETASTYDPSIENFAGSGATGLIQFMPATAKGLGTTTAQLAAMGQIQQLQYVKAYFQPYAKKITNLNDIYMSIFLPRYVGKHSSTVVAKKDARRYEQNKGLDLNKDGEITIGEITRRVREYYYEGMKMNNVETFYMEYYT